MFLRFCNFCRFSTTNCWIAYTPTISSRILATLLRARPSATALSVASDRFLQRCSHHDATCSSTAARTRWSMAARSAGDGAGAGAAAASSASTAAAAAPMASPNLHPPSQHTQVCFSTRVVFPPRSRVSGAHPEWSGGGVPAGAEAPGWRVWRGRGEPGQGGVRGNARSLCTWSS